MEGPKKIHADEYRKQNMADALENENNNNWSMNKNWQRILQAMPDVNHHKGDLSGWQRLWSATQDPDWRKKFLDMQAMPFLDTPNPANCHDNSPKQRTWALDEFERTDHLGAGSFGQVFKVMHKRTNTPFVVKIVAKTIINEHELTEKLENEINVQFQHRHPNIVRLLNNYEDADNLYLLVECASDGHLSQMLCKWGGKLQEREAAHIFVDVSSGLSHLHNRGVVHSNLKKENILMCGNVAKITDHNLMLLKKNMVMGWDSCDIIDYHSPEIVRNEAHDFTSDIWAIGVLLFEMLMGCLPFTAVSRTKTSMQIMFLDLHIPPPITPLAGNLIKKLLLKEKKERLSLAQAIRHDWVQQHITAKIVKREVLPQTLTHAQKSISPRMLECNPETSTGKSVARLPAAMTSFQTLCQCGWECYGANELSCPTCGVVKALKMMPNRRGIDVLCDDTDFVLDTTLNATQLSCHESIWQETLNTNVGFSNSVMQTVVNLPPMPNKFNKAAFGNALHVESLLKGGLVSDVASNLDSANKYDSVKDLDITINVCGGIPDDDTQDCHGTGNGNFGHGEGCADNADVGTGSSLTLSTLDGSLAMSSTTCDGIDSRDSDNSDGCNDQTADATATRAAALAKLRIAVKIVQERDKNATNLEQTFW